MNALLFLAVRASHVLMAALWIGSAVFVSLLLLPAVEASGSSGGQVMARLRRGVSMYMAVLSGTTVVTGLYLFWRFTGGFDPGVSVSHAGLAFGTGGTSGILAGIIGGGVVGRSANGVANLSNQAFGMAEGPARGALMHQAALLRRRAKIGTRVVIMLQMIALVLMSVGHYV